MKIVKLKGGLGNQMFQYAFALYLKQNTCEEVKIDLSYYDSFKDSVRKPRILMFDTTLDVASQKEINECLLLKNIKKDSRLLNRGAQVFETLFNSNYFFERSMMPYSLDQIRKYNYFDGYWQSYKYVAPIYDLVTEEFVNKDDLSTETKKSIEEVLQVNSVFIGIRRGDYLKEKNLYGQFEQDYYERAMQFIAERIESPVFYVFSNDIKWVRNNMNFSKYNVIYRDDEIQTSDFEELIIMSQCKNSIIINSTFHWWGAMLGQKDKIVIAPKRWFANGKEIDIIPNEWITLDNNKEDVFFRGSI